MTQARYRSLYDARRVMAGIMGNRREEWRRVARVVETGAISVIESQQRLTPSLFFPYEQPDENGNRRHERFDLEKGQAQGDEVAAFPFNGCYLYKGIAERIDISQEGTLSKFQAYRWATVPGADSSLLIHIGFV
ncbi:hypothetical protein [Pseudomonas sp. YJ42]|uniref:hypothetical protein n=1 Tax=Pseudomonas sp. YJ42 TaxID=3392115 RepID=UPI00399F8C5E